MDVMKSRPISCRCFWMVFSPFHFRVFIISFVFLQLLSEKQLEIWNYRLKIWKNINNVFKW